jgi:diguanylate cyclase (GGDEF)-like protein
MVIENAPAAGSPLATPLIGAGYDVRAVANCDSAVCSAKADRPDIILLDIASACDDGGNVCRRFSDDGVLRQIPIVFVGPIAAAIQAVASFGAGEVDFLATPFVPEEVVARVRIHLEQNRTRDELDCVRTLLEQLVDERTAELRREIAERKLVEVELVLARQRAEGASNAKSEFLSMMSHELRTPLNAVLGFSEMMRDQVLGPIGNTRYVEFANHIHSSAGHLLGVINDILDYSEIEAGKLDLSDDVISPNELCRTSLRVWASAAAERDIVLEARLDESLPGLRIDGRLVQQALNNLLDNSIKFTDPGGRVVVRSEMRPEGIALVLSDSGIGMTEEEIALALAPFTQVDQRLSRKYGGTGLGLPLAERCIRMHGGTLTIYSTRGSGTEVHILFPSHRIIEASLEDLAPPQSVPGGAWPQPLNRPRTISEDGGILVVDDMVPAQILLASLLAKEGYYVRTADDGEQALAAIAAKPPELIVLDIEMPGIDGFEVCRRLKQIEHLRDIPVIFISAANEVGSKVEGFKAGAIDYITKPYQSKEVLARVRTHLELFRSRQQVDLLNTELTEANRELHKLSQIDGLLGIANRLYFDQSLTKEWRRALRETAPLSVLMIDVDQFKAYNDTYGHLAGDACLKRIAQAVASGLRRPVDLLARYGGEELVVVLPSTPLQGARAVAETIIDKVREAGIAHGASTIAPYVTVSIGAASMVPDEKAQPNDLVAIADSALYKAKAAGRNRFCVW